MADGEPGLAEAAVTETLRLHPPVPLGSLRRLRHSMTIAGWRLPAGATVASCSLLIHRRPDGPPADGMVRRPRHCDRPAAAPGGSFVASGPMPRPGNDAAPAAGLVATALGEHGLEAIEVPLIWRSLNPSVPP